MTENQVKHMVARFLSWKLPENFHPDAGISFKPDFNEHTQWPMKHQPVGTNLFDADQAEAMVRHMVADLPWAHLVFSEEPTEQGDMVAAQMRAYYDENRPLTFIEWLFGKRSTDRGICADELMLGLMQIAVRASKEWRAEFANPLT